MVILALLIDYTGRNTADMAYFDALAPLRAHAGVRRTIGLDDDTIGAFAATHADLAAALTAAGAEYARIRHEFADLLDLDEDAQIHAVQGGLLNFSPVDPANPPDTPGLRRCRWRAQR